MRKLSRSITWILEMHMKKTWLIAGLLLATTPAIALQTIGDKYQVSDVVGIFADVGYVGPFAGTKTVDEAHILCMSNVSVSTQKSTGDVSSFSEVYRTCMSQYVPFKKAGDGESNACAMEKVTWGECSGSTQATPDGTSVSVKNVLSEFEGYATFQCSGGKLTYQSGGCAKVVESCDSGLIAEWPVTAPLWADPSSATPYLDKYGQSRHSPKPQCQARMPEALSGKLLFPNPTAAELYDAARYDIAGSASPQRCFNNEWIHDASAGTSTCTYVPKSCPAKSTSYNGCGFSLPAAAHDSIYVASNPTPFNSTGSMEAYCWDGEWEIKSSSCQLSCDENIAANQWKGADPLACAHPVIPKGQRIRPGLNVLVPNETPGMVGNVAYLCDNGVMKETSQSCAPKSCDHIDELSWGGSCSHAAITGKTWQHGEKYTISSYTDIFTAVGSAVYECKYGGLSSGETGAMDLVGSPTCDGSSTPICNTTPETPPSTCNGGIIVDGKCCVRSADGSIQCDDMIVDPPVETGVIYGPWSDWVDNGAVTLCSSWTPDPSTMPDGQIYTASRTCQQPQRRSRDVFQSWSDGSQQKIREEHEDRNVAVNQDKEMQGQKVTTPSWSQRVSFSMGFHYNSPVSGYSYSTDLVRIAIDGVYGVSDNSGSTLSWNSGLCPTCFVSDVQVLPHGYPDVSITPNVFQQGLASAPDSGYGIGAVPYRVTQGSRPSDDSRDTVVTLRITIMDADGNTASIEVAGIHGQSEMVCQVDNWTSC